MSKQIDPIKRIEFLAKKFDVFDDNELIDIMATEHDSGVNKHQHLYDVEESGHNVIYAIYIWNERKLINEGIEVPNKVRVGESVFINIVQADPTEHKEYVQWMLTTFVRLIKESKFSEAIRFVNEDLWSASEYLGIFHREKYRGNFKKLCFKNEAFKNILDSSDINQYRDLSQLYDAVDPYIEKDTSKLERDIRVMVKMREGLIPYEDRKVIIFNPLTYKASKLFKPLTSWCTTISKESFNRYPNYKTSFGKKSKLYVLIYKTYLLEDGHIDKTDEVYQLHFESKQFMDRKDSAIPKLDELVGDNVGLLDYFYDELILFAKANKENYHKNSYIDALVKFGFTDILFEVLPSNIDKIMVVGTNLRSTPDISKFTKCEFLYLFDCKLETLHASIGDLKSLVIASFGDNKLKSLPNTIGNLSNLQVLNLKGNDLITLPESIQKLDKSKGGSLRIISVDKALEREAKFLLPNVLINEYEELVNR